MKKQTNVSREIVQLTAIGRALRNARLDQSVQLQQLEEMSGVTSLTISKIEKGTLDNCSLKTLNKVAEALGLKITISIA